MALNEKRTDINDVSTPKPLTGCKDSDFQRDNQVVPFVQVGDKYEKIIVKYDVLGRPYESSVMLNKETISERYGKGMLSRIPYYDDYVIVPSHTNYQKIIGTCLNIYNPLPNEAKEGQHPHWDMLMKRVFGYQETLGWDYLTILYRNPTHILPVLCLVSPENGTGKSTFGNALSYLFGLNVGFFTQDDLSSSFNVWIRHLVAVFEEISDTKHTLNKIKAMSTAQSATLNQKYKPQISFAPFVKIIILSNNSDSFLKANENDIRYWILRLKPMKTVDFVPDFDTKLREEIPAVMHTLQTREISTPKTSRMWFSPQLIATDALDVVRKESRSSCAKDILIWAEEWGGDIYVTEREVYLEQERKYTRSQIRDALRKELHLSNPNQRYIDRDGSPQNGRAYHIVIEQKNVTLL